MFDLISHGKNLKELQRLSDLQSSTEGGSNAEYTLIADESPKPKVNWSAAVVSLIFFIVTLTLIVYGIIRLHDCPAENRIAISVVVLGAMALVARILNCPFEFRMIFRKEQHFRKNIYIIVLNVLIQVVMLSTFIAMSYWTFTIKPDTNPEDLKSPNYCDLQFYRNTYWACVVGLVFIGLIFVMSCACIFFLGIVAYALINEGN